jgi:hypothetical protein
MLSRLLAFPALLSLAFPASAQQLPDGQGETEYRRTYESSPGFRGGILSFEAWQQAAGVANILPTWQVVRTASMWRECGGAPFEVPPAAFWPDMVRTLRFIRDHVRPAVGPVEAVSGYRNPALNACARGSQRSAHLDFFALDLIPQQPLSRRQLFERICPVHSAQGQGAEVGLGFYSFTRFHIDTRGFRRWGSAGPSGNESPCAVLERGEDPEAPPLPPPVEASPVTTVPTPSPAPLQEPAPVPQTSEK